MEFYDWATAEADLADDPIPGQRPGPTQIPGPRVTDAVEVYTPRVLERVNPVNGHGSGCLCRQCPASARELAQGQPVTEPKKANALMDQVVPISILMAVFTICMVTLIPFVAPLMTSLITFAGMGVASLAIVAWLANRVTGSKAADNLTSKK